MLWPVVFLFVFPLLDANIVRRDVGKKVVAAKGTLLCGTTPAKEVTVKLFRVPQTKKTEDLTQVLDEKLTGDGGMFHLEGNTNGFMANETNIEGVVSIYHLCEEDASKAEKKGYRRVNIFVPEEYVSAGAKAKKTFDLGTLNLQLIYPNEKHIKLEKKP